MISIQRLTSGMAHRSARKYPNNKCTITEKAELYLALQALSLALQCLSFDFVGTCLDDSSEDFGTIQVHLLPDWCTSLIFIVFYDSQNLEAVVLHWEIPAAQMSHVTDLSVKVLWPRIRSSGLCLSIKA